MMTTMPASCPNRAPGETAANSAGALPPPCGWAGRVGALSDLSATPVALAKRRHDPCLRPDVRGERPPAAHGGERLRLDRGRRVELVDGGPQLDLGAAALAAVAFRHLPDRAVAATGEHAGTGERIGQVNPVVPAAPLGLDGGIDLGGHDQQAV